MKSLFILILFVCVENIFSVEKQQDSPLLIQGEQSDFIVVPDSSSIIVSSYQPKSKQSLKPIEPIDNEFKSVMNSTNLTISDNDCVKHLNEKECLVDVTCGWCMISTGGACVQGNYAGPSDLTVPCPVYVTYQTKIDEDDDVTNDEQIENLWNSKNQNNSSISSQNDSSFEDDSASQRIIFPIEDLQNQNDDNNKFLPVPKPQPDRISQWSIPSKKQQNTTVTNQSNTIKENNIINKRSKALVPIVTDSTITSKYDSTISPCGLPGVPSFICQSWLKLNCGPDKLTEDSMKSLSAANNAYDWCATMFENKPEIFLPKATATIPWYINGHLVQ